MTTDDPTPSPDAQALARDAKFLINACIRIHGETADADHLDAIVDRLSAGWTLTKPDTVETAPSSEGVDEDDIADAISDSMDMDWTSRDGARAVMRLLREKGVVQ